jgi:hypothetical protein
VPDRDLSWGGGTPSESKVRAWIAPATFCQRVWSALFKRAILAVPILAIVYYGAPSCYVGRHRQAEGQMTNSHPDYRNHADHRHPLWLVLVITTNNRLASFCCGDVRFGSKADICAAKRHVRFTPNSDIDCVSMSAWAKSGHQVITTKTRQAVSVAFVASLSACRREAIWFCANVAGPDCRTIE